jgi:hypothetical protein
LVDWLIKLIDWLIKLNEITVFGKISLTEFNSQFVNNKFILILAHTKVQKKSRKEILQDFNISLSIG